MAEEQSPGSGQAAAQSAEAPATSDLIRCEIQPRRQGALRMVSWNVNGLRALHEEGLPRRVPRRSNADIFCPAGDQAAGGGPRQARAWSCPATPQYLELRREEGLLGHRGVLRAYEPHGRDATAFGAENPDNEGRHHAPWSIRTASGSSTCYTPNAQDGLARLALPHGVGRRLPRLSLCDWTASKPVITCGDLNVAHNEIDLKNPGPNRGNAGFSDEERAKFGRPSGRPGSRIRSATCTPRLTGRVLAGGATASTRARTTRAGASTTSW